jgi:hypothetical protein
MTRLRLRMSSLVLLGLVLQPSHVSAQGLPVPPPVSPILAPNPFGPGAFTPAPPLTENATAALDVSIDPTTSLTDTPPPTADDAGSPPADAGAAPGSGADLAPPEDPSTSTALPSPGFGPGPLPVPGPVITPPLPGPGVGLPVPVPGAPPSQSTQPAPLSPAAQVARPGPAANEPASARVRLGGIISAAEFLLWLAQLLPLLLAALLAFLAGLLSAWVVPGGGVVWRLPPDLTHRLEPLVGAHAAMVGLADAALALIIALVGLGLILGPRAGLPVLEPRAIAPRLAIAILAAHGGLAIGGWAIDLHDALLGVFTPADLPGWDPGHWQGGAGEMLVGVIYGLLGLLLALGGWLRLALIDLLLVAGPLLAVLWVLPLTSHWGEWALSLFGNLLLGQWLQVLALWLGRGLLGAPSPELSAAFAKDFAAIALLLVALRVPGLLPGPRGVGALSTALGLLLGARAVSSLISGLGNIGRDRFLDNYLRRKELDLEFEAVAARVPDDDVRPRRRRP